MINKLSLLIWFNTQFHKTPHSNGTMKKVLAITCIVCCVCVCVCVCVSVYKKEVFACSHVTFMLWYHWFGFTGSYATFSFSSNFWLCTVSTFSHTTAVCCCSCVFGADLELCLFLFHLLMQTVSNTPHTVPAMNVTSEQTAAVMAVTAAVEMLLSETETSSEVKGEINSKADYTCAQTLWVRVPPSIFPTQQCPPSLWKKPWLTLVD